MMSAFSRKITISMFYVLPAALLPIIKLKYLKRFIIFILIILQIGVGVVAQTNPKPKIKKSPETKAVKPEIELCLNVARRLVDDALTLEAKSDRIPFLVRLADVIWDWDEGLARNLLARSFSLILEIANERDEKLKGESDKNTIDVLFQRIINVAFVHDAALAIDFEVKRNDFFKSKENTSSIKTDDPLKLSTLLLSESANLVKRDEKQARSLFQKSVAYYVTHTHFAFLINLRKQSPELADRLFADILEVISRRQLNEANEILILASYLFSPNAIVGYDLVTGYNAANTSSALSATPSNTALAKQYLTTLFYRLNPGEPIPVSVVYLALKNLLPQFSAFVPELVDEVYGKLGSLKSQANFDEIAKYEESNSASDNNETWRDRLKKAEEIGNEDFRDLEYFTIINGYLLRQKDFSNAYSVIDKVANNSLREKLRDYVHLLVIKENVKQKNSETGYNLAYDKIKDPMLRTLALCEIAYFFRQQKKPIESTQSLEFAIKESEHISNEQDRLQIKFAVANLYLDINDIRAFEIIKDSFKEIGKVSNFNTQRSHFDFQITVYGLKNELSLVLPIQASLIGTVEAMCRVNCTETLSTCSYIEKKNIRLWASLVAINRILSNAKGSNEKVNKGK